MSSDDGDGDNKQQYNAKVLKKLGLQLGDLFVGCFQPANGGLLVRSEYNMFWDQAGSAKDATVFLDLILQKLQTALETKDYDSQQLTSLVNTVSFVSLYMDFKASDFRIKKFLRNWQKEDQLKDLSRQCPAAKEVMRTLNLRVDGTDMVGPLIIGCSTLHSVEEFRVISNSVENPTMDDSDIKSGETCFLYSHLKRLCLDKEQLILVLQSTVSKMLTLQHQMKLNPKVAETTLLALLHMLKQFIAHAPVTDPAFLKRTMSTIQQFYLWPNPYGTFTLDVLRALQSELVFPGSTMRKALVRETATAHFDRPSKEEKTSAPTKAPAVYYFVDAEDRGSVIFANIMELYKFDPSSVGGRRKATSTKSTIPLSAGGNLPIETQALTILNLLKNDLDITEEEFADFKKLSDDQIGTFFDEALAMTTKVTKPDTAKDTRNRLLAKFKKDIMDAAKKAKGKDATWSLPDTTQEPYLPALPACNHLSIPGKTTYEMVNKEELSLMCLTYMPYPTTPFYEQLKAVLEQYKDTRKRKEGEKNLELRLVVAGGDRLLHNFLCAYLLVIQQNPEYIRYVDPKILLVPFRTNHFASYIARFDSWYNRHIYIPFRSPQFILPWIKSDDSNSYNDSNEVVGAVGQYYREAIEQYARESTVTNNVRVYKVEGWFGPAAKKTDMPDHVIPFVQRVEVGVLAAMEASRAGKSGGKPADDSKVEETLKNFNYNPPETTVKFTRMDLSGKKQEPITDEAISYQSIIVSNVPYKGDPCFPADPCAKWLEMHATVHKSANKAAVAKNVLLNDPKQHIANVEISCSNEKANFSVLVDGTPFGPYHHIKIKRARFMNEKEKNYKQAITFPLQAFFPLDM